MSKKMDKYPNKKDYEPYIGKYAKDDGELPLADPSESNATEVFRKNESKQDEEQHQSAYGQNKKEK